MRAFVEAKKGVVGLEDRGAEVPKGVLGSLEEIGDTGDTPPPLDDEASEVHR